ncbi:MAG: hypothetical protein HYZ16_10250 [Bacteroidetes bacterium]|jgi:hypothetical protein|nr:hypothetical protein [Bacteroidota bacterium]
MAFLIDKGFMHQLLPQEHAVEFFSPLGNKVIKLGLPLVWPALQGHESLDGYMEHGDGPQPGQLSWVLLVRAGEAALGWVIQGKLMKYKVVRKYMVRKKQGKAQVSHLKTKGKSRAGSRIRLAQTEAFFEEINHKLQEWKQQEEPQLIVMGVAPTLKAAWAQHPSARAFEFDDPRLRRVNWTVGLPRENELKKAIWHLDKARLSIFDPQLASLLASIANAHGQIYRQNT